MPTNFLVAALLACFAAAQIEAAWATGRWATTLPLVAQEALVAAFFLTRRRPDDVSRRPFDWALGVTGVALPFLLRPEDGPTALTWIGQGLHAGGLVLAAVATAFLGRSIGLVAANRGVRRSGPYRWVRHPMYVAQAVAAAGFVLCHPCTRNLVVLLTAVAVFHARAVAEERLLARDPAYRAYVDATPWRFVPYLH
jgi:protein-S-isoprenylcysteine O-methyltransferase Ste14